eukprot:TRINITY_DN6145_c0_g1_i2.p1 TRINITY_DN6145_c0_g1~~TRINITY_DN6145_c0_g1_i2.p1  ORF type:complete len:543 (+),score=130.32 TRINITY_DN6145_c0_g1_i2:81-1631(+)
MASALFGSYTLAEIAAVAAAKKHEEATKQQRLRDFIADHYKELLESADNILRIREAVTGIADQVQHTLQTWPAAVSGAAAGRDEASSAAAGSTRRQVLLRAAAVIEAPKLVFRALDDTDFIGAVMHVFQAQHEHTQLTALSASDPAVAVMVEALPLFKRQWAATGMLPAAITASAKQAMCSIGLTVAAYANAVTAVFLLSRQSAVSLFQEFLTLRLDAVVTASKVSDDPAGGPAGFSDLVSAIVATLESCSAIFMAQNAKRDPPLLVSLLNAPRTTRAPSVRPHSQLQLQSQPRSPRDLAAQVDPEGLLADITYITDLAAARVAAGTLERETLRTVCAGWVTDCAAACKAQLYGHLCRISSAAELASLAGHVKSELAQPHNKCSIAAVGASVDVWGTLFFGAFRARAEDLVRVSLRALGAFPACVADAIASLPSSELQPGASVWQRQAASAVVASSEWTARQRVALATPPLWSLVVSFDARLHAFVDEATVLAATVGDEPRAVPGQKVQMAQHHYP